MPVSEKEEKSAGNAHVVRLVTQVLLEGERAGETLVEKITQIFTCYLENTVMMQWDAELGVCL